MRPGWHTLRTRRGNLRRYPQNLGWCVRMVQVGEAVYMLTTRGANVLAWDGRR